jgi:hypothetical protein
MSVDVRTTRHFVEDWPKLFVQSQRSGRLEQAMDGHDVTVKDEEDEPLSPTIPHTEPTGETGSLGAALEHEANPVKRFLKLLGPGLITGAADDDPSGIGTYATAGAAFLARPDWGDVLRATFLPRPRFDHQYLTTLLAILGTTISPYLFFWQASEEVEEEVSMGRTRLAARKGATDAELKYEQLDTIAGMIFCNVVFYFVILAAAATLRRRSDRWPVMPLRFCLPSA